MRVIGGEATRTPNRMNEVARGDERERRDETRETSRFLLLLLLHLLLVRPLRPSVKDRTGAKGEKRKA